MTLSRKTDANLDRVFVENTLVFIDPKIERGGGRLPPPPWLHSWIGVWGIGEDYTIGEKKNVCHE